jgi:hypothetical protein
VVRIPGKNHVSEAELSGKLYDAIRNKLGISSYMSALEAMRSQATMVV